MQYLNSKIEQAVLNLKWCSMKTKNLVMIPRNVECTIFEGREEINMNTTRKVRRVNEKCQAKRGTNNIIRFELTNGSSCEVYFIEIIRKGDQTVLN